VTTVHDDPPPGAVPDGDLLAGAAYVETRRVPLDELTRFSGNAKRGDVPAILASLRRNGQYRSLIVRSIENGPLIILAGNHTSDALALHGPGICQAQQEAAAAIAAGRKAIECALCRGGDWDETARCEIITCDDATARRINLVDNRAAELGHWDEGALAELLKAALADDGGLEGTGYDDAYLTGLLADLGDALAEPVALTDVDDAPEPPVEPISKLGDVWLLGPHKLLVGDCTDTAAVGELFVRLAECMWTDPPYGVNYTGKTADALTIANDGGENLPELLAGAFATATTVLRCGAPVYIAHPDEGRRVFQDALEGAGWSLRQNLIWVKDQMALGWSDYHYQHEPILYGFTAAPAGSGRLGRGGERWYGDDAQTTVFFVDKPTRNDVHPTMKPVALIAAALRNSCPPGGIVYEPFGGSGSTLIAAHSTGRVCYAVELDPRYADVIARRYQEHTGTMPVLASTGQPVDFTTVDDDDGQGDEDDPGELDRAGQ
jgi:DNA modification methylase